MATASSWCVVRVYCETGGRPTGGGRQLTDPDGRGCIRGVPPSLMGCGVVAPVGIGQPPRQPSPPGVTPCHPESQGARGPNHADLVEGVVALVRSWLRRGRWAVLSLPRPVRLTVLVASLELGDLSGGSRPLRRWADGVCSSGVSASPSRLRRGGAHEVSPVSIE